MTVMNALKDVYTMKGTDAPKYYLGDDVEHLDEHWNKEHISAA